MLFREGANPVHMGSAAIGVLPHQLLTLHIAFHDHRPPTKGVKVENAVIQIMEAEVRMQYSLSPMVNSTEPSVSSVLRPVVLLGP